MSELIDGNDFEPPRNVNPEAQVLSQQAPCGASPVATIRHVSSGKFLCGSCEEEHDFVAFSLDQHDGDERVVFMLPDEDGRAFARQATSCSEDKTVGGLSLPPNVELRAQVLGSQDEDGRNVEAGVRHVSSGVYRCSVGGTVHSYVAFAIDRADGGGAYEMFLLADEDAAQFASGLRHALPVQ